MIYLIIEVACQCCSFRNPDFQNFHKTYELPPPTTIIGMAGAALGLSPKASQDFFNQGFEFGIAGSHAGNCSDLWKYQKLKGKEFIADVLTRELLFENKYILVFGHQDNTKIQKLKNAFEFPVYALTLGNSDGLAKITAVNIHDNVIECDRFENCIVEGNLLEKVLNNPHPLEFSLKDGTDPINYEVPVKFQYESDYGIRKVVKRKEFSFIGPSLYVKGIKCKGLIYKNYQIPLFNLDD